MKRLLGLVILFASLVVWVVLLFASVEHLRGTWELNHRVNALRAQGERLSVIELQPPSATASQNAAIELLSLTNRLQSVISNLDNVPPMLRLAAPGRAVVAWRLKEWSRNSKSTNDWGNVGKELANCPDLVESVRGALQKPAYDSGFDYQTGFVRFQIAPIAVVRHAAQLLSVAHAYELNKGATEAAYQDLYNLVKLVGVQKPEPILISQLVRQTCALIAFNAIWQALQTNAWSESQLSSIQSAWQSCDFIHDMEAALSMEQALILDFYQQIGESNEKLMLAFTANDKATNFMVDDPDRSASDHFVRRWVHVPLWQMAWVDQAQLLSLNQWQVAKSREQFARTNGYAALAALPDTPNRAVPRSLFRKKLNWYDKARLPFDADNVGMEDNIIRKTLSLQTQQQMALTAIAIERYRLKKGRIPPELSALVPEFLPAMPRDYMDGKFLRYQSGPNGSYQLYSVGLDGKDNGGDPFPKSNTGNYVRIWDGRDAVWPAPASTEEAERSLRQDIHEVKEVRE